MNRTENSRKLACPRCSKGMETVLHEETEVDRCSQCGGVWVEHVEERQILLMKPQVFTMDELRRLRRRYEPLGRREKVKYMPCPACGVLMHRRNWGSHSGVVVDKCDDHGTWYDDGEIEKIRDFIEHGGIDYEKMKAPQKEAVRLESRLVQEVGRLDRRIDSAYRRARLWSMIGF